MPERLRQMILKEFIQVFRDKRMKAIVFVVPLIQLMVFGYAVTTDVNNIPTAVYDLDKSYESRELLRRFESSGYFDILYHVEKPGALGELIEKGKVITALQINPRFSEYVRKRTPAEVQIIVDGTDSNTATIAASYAARIVSKYALDIRIRKVDYSPMPLDTRTRAWYNPDLKSRNYNVPGVIALMIMLICLLLTSMAIVREREIGTMEQLMVTPIRPAELILGKTLPFAVIGFFDMFLVAVVGISWFQIPIRGSVPLLTLCTAIYLLSVLGIGLFISTVSKTQQQALMSTFLFFAPAVLLSGFMFPIENMPEIIQYCTLLNPLRYFLVILRGIFLKGNGIGILWPQMVELLALGVIVLAVSSMRFRKRLG